MEEQLKKYAIELIEALKNGGQFIVEQAPGVVHSYLNYYLIYHIIWVVICAATVASIAYLTKMVISNLDKDDYCYDVNLYGAIGFSLAVNIIPLIGFFENLFSAIKIIVAPKVYLIEALMDLL